MWLIRILEMSDSGSGLEVKSVGFLIDCLESGPKECVTVYPDVIGLEKLPICHEV